jgi:hypothetical protein
MSQSLPPNLGLIESRDGGETWKNVSLLGQADFHVLESAGRRIIAGSASRASATLSFRHRAADASARYGEQMTFITRRSTSTRACAHRFAPSICRPSRRSSALR